MNGSCHLPHFASTGDECCQNHPFLLHYESELLSTVTTPLYVLLVANVLQSGALPQWCCCQRRKWSRRRFNIYYIFDRDRREAVVAGGTIPLLSFQCLVEYPSLLLILFSYNSVHSSLHNPWDRHCPEHYKPRCFFTLTPGRLLRVWL